MKTANIGRVAAIFASASVALLLVGCSEKPAMNDDQQSVTDLNASNAGPEAASCDGVVAGCPCESAGIEVSCGKVERDFGAYATCSEGMQKCGSDGKWSKCVGDGIATRSVPTTGQFGGVKLAALATTASLCDFNPCDQYCKGFVDNAAGVDAGSKFKTSDAGISLAAADAGPSGNTCTGLTPLTAVNMTVTSLSPVVTSPATGSFSTSLLPAGCLTAPLTPLWGVNRYDLGTITTSGVYTHVVPVPATVGVTAYAGSFSTTANVNVTVAVTDTSGAPSGFTTASFAGTVNSVEAASALVYPYDATIFPLGLSAPLVMWKRATATAAKAVKVTLKFPATGTATFTWTAIVAEGSQRYQIPQSAWAAFDQTAKGSTGLLTVQRIDGASKLQTAMTANLQFSTANLRGRIYYTHYGSTTDVKVVLPSGTAAPTSAFTPPLANNCGVCHSMSASGNKFVTSSQGSGANNGYNTFAISNIAAATGNLTALNAGPAGLGDSRGLAYAPLTASGTFALLGNNWWGNVNSSSSATVPGTAGPAYKIYQLPSTATAPTDVSNTGFGGTNNAWGLGTAQLYTPAFSPDNKRLAFVNADTAVDSTGLAASAAASRQGLSTYDFDESLKKFSGRKIIARTTATASPVALQNTYARWPAWEIDSRTLIFQTSAKTDDDGFDWYAGMLPSGCCGRTKVHGQLWSMDAGPIGGSPVAPVAMTNVNKGLGAASVWGTDDTNRNYQPTMLGVAAGGFRWAVFTSVRAYGNLINTATGAITPNTNKLWVAAIDNATSTTTDRSHPPFFLPNQDATAGVLNERGYWTLDACKAPDLTASTCGSSDECCGYNANPALSTASCVVDSPLTSPPAFHCKSSSAAVCKAVGQSCSSDSSCCGFPTTLCISGTCQNPPPIVTYTAATYTRDYSAICRPDQRLEWRYFDYKTQFPSPATGAAIVFSVQTASTSAGLAAATAVNLATQNATNSSWLGANVTAKLDAATPKQASKQFLRVSMAITPSTGGAGSPVLTNWRQAYDCIDVE